MSDLSDLLFVIGNGGYVVLDTETTGLGPTAEACQIAIIDHNGHILLNSLVKPSKPIPPDAIRIHGITNEKVADAPAIASLAPELLRITYHKTVIIYNADYDIAILKQSLLAAGLGPSWARLSHDIVGWICAMKAYSEHYAEWDDYHGNWAWHKLTVAAGREGLPITDAHSALGDCLMTLFLCKRMLERASEESRPN